MGLLGHPSNCRAVVASGAGRRPARCTIVEQMGPERPGEWDAMLDAPRIYHPVSALADYTEIIGHWHAHVGYRSRALPRGAITLIIDVGQRQQLDFYAADGRTRLSVPPAFLTGSHTVSYVLEMSAGEPARAVHVRPGGAFR